MTELGLAPAVLGQLTKLCQIAFKCIFFYQRILLLLIPNKHIYKRKWKQYKLVCLVNKGLTTSLLTKWWKEGSPSLYVLILYAACHVVCWLRFPLSVLSFSSVVPFWVVHPQRAQRCATSTAAVLGAVSESLGSSPVQPSSTVCSPAPTPAWQSPLWRGPAAPLQHRLCQDDCIRPVRRFPVKDLP